MGLARDRPDGDRYAATACTLLDEYPDFVHSQSQAAIYEIVRQFDPALFHRIEDMVKRQRWEITTSQWVEGEKNVVSDESLARQLLYSKEFFAEHWGIDGHEIRLDFEPDTFGRSQAMPTIVQEAGCQWLYHCRGGPGPLGFRWQAPDGSWILAWDDFRQWYGGAVAGKEGLGALRWYQESGDRHFLKVYGVGDHGGGPTRRDIRDIYRFMDWPLFPTVRFGRFSDHFEEPAERDQLPVVRGELGSVFQGCYTSVAELKRQSSENEPLLSIAEGLQVMALLMDADVTQPIAKSSDAWRQLLFNQFRDIPSGSGISATYDHALGHGQDVAALARTLAHHSMVGISRSVATGGGEATSVPVIMFNPLSWTREEVVEITLYEKFDRDTPVAVIGVVGQSIPVRYRYDHHMGSERLRILLRARVGGLGYATVHVTSCADDAGTIATAPGERFEVRAIASGNATARWSGAGAARVGVPKQPDLWRSDELADELVIFRQMGLSVYNQGWTVETVPRH